MRHNVLLWINLVFVICLALSNAAMMLFVNGAYPPWGPIAGSFLFADMFLFLVGLVLLILDITVLLRDFAVLPMVILIVGIIFAFYVAHVFSWFGDQRFARNITRYEKVVQMIGDGRIKPRDHERIVRLPTEYKDLAYITIVHDPNFTKEQGLVISFHIGTVGIWGHKAYVYTSTGNTSKGSYLAQEWPHRIEVRPGWFKVGD